MSSYRLISAERTTFPVSVMCEVLGVSTAGFYDWASRAPSDRALSDAWLLEQIKDIHKSSRGVYGARRIHAELDHARGIRVGRKRVERLMRQAGISGLVTRKRGKTTIRVPGIRTVPDLVERDFRPAAPDRLWVGTSPISAPSRVGFTSPPSKTPSAAGSSAGRWTATCAQNSSATRWKWPSRAAVPAPGPVHHSDQGSQYVALLFGQ